MEIMLPPKGVTLRGQKAVRQKHEREAAEQAALVEWASFTRINGDLIGEYLVHMPNEGKRGAKAASDFKKLGGRKGYPDLLLEIPASGYHGLRIEMKAPVKPAPVTPEQKEWIARLEQKGFRALVCYGFDEARQAILTYLEESNVC